MRKSIALISSTSILGLVFFLAMFLNIKLSSVEKMEVFLWSKGETRADLLFSTTITYFGIFSDPSPKLPLWNAYNTIHRVQY